jgi:hypothetical protein
VPRAFFAALACGARRCELITPASAPLVPCSVQQVRFREQTHAASEAALQLRQAWQFVLCHVPRIHSSCRQDASSTYVHACRLVM